MNPSAPPETILYAGAPPERDVCDLLENDGFGVTLRRFDGDATRGNSAKLILIDAAHGPGEALRWCERHRSRGDEPYVPILFLGDANNGSTRRASLESGADTFLARPFTPPDLLAQAHALLRIKDRHDQLAARAADAQRVSQRLQAAYHQIDQELELARRIQESFLPQSLPSLPNVRFAVHYQPCGQVGGDFYDVFRLDESHVGLYVADAMGHGVPASLLTIFVKKGVRAKEIVGQSYRLTPPNEVLHKLNHDMIEQALSETPFITMVYGLFNCDTGELQFSRAGHPYPLYLPRIGPPELWEMEGSLLGVFDTRYHIQTQQLRPGDKLLFYTDGMDGASFAQHPVGLSSLLAAAEAHRGLPIADLVPRLASDLFQQTRQSDDLTLLGLEIPG